MALTFLNELAIRSLKIVDIGYITLIYFSIGMILAKLFDMYNGEFDEKKEKKKSMLRYGLEIVGIMWMIGIVSYIVRNLVELIPSPFNDISGFDHMKVKELKSAAVFSFIFMYFQTHLKAKMQYFYDNLSI